MIPVCGQIAIPEREIEFRPIRARGPGGQNVNKVASAVELRFDVPHSSLPEVCKTRLLQMPDRRINREGVVVIKAQTHRDQLQNREEALRRLRDLIAAACRVERRRIPTQPTRAARRRRLEAKRHRARIKAGRGTVRVEE